MKNTKGLTNKMFAKVCLISLLTLFVLSIGGCGPPYEVKSLAISKTKSNWRVLFSNNKDFRVKSLGKQNVSREDKANGVEEILDVKVTFLATGVGTKSGKWYYESNKVKVIKKNGKYIVR
jgi:hypothetical protein